MSCNLEGYLVSRKERNFNPFLILETLRRSIYYSRPVVPCACDIHLSSFWLPFRVLMSGIVLSTPASSGSLSSIFLVLYVYPNSFSFGELLEPQGQPSCSRAPDTYFWIDLKFLQPCSSQKSSPVPSEDFSFKVI